MSSFLLSSDTWPLCITWMKCFFHSELQMGYNQLIRISIWSIYAFQNTLSDDIYSIEREKYSFVKWWEPLTLYWFFLFFFLKSTWMKSFQLLSFNFALGPSETQLNRCSTICEDFELLPFWQSRWKHHSDDTNFWAQQPTQDAHLKYALHKKFCLIMHVFLCYFHSLLFSR